MPTWSNLKDAQTVQVGTVLKACRMVTLVVSNTDYDEDAYVVGVGRIAGGTPVSSPCTKMKCVHDDGLMATLQKSQREGHTYHAALSATCVHNSQLYHW